MSKITFYCWIIRLHKYDIYNTVQKDNRNCMSFRLTTTEHTIPFYLTMKYSLTVMIISMK